jgi:mono/diheme cytochrome c family protein
MKTGRQDVSPAAEEDVMTGRSSTRAIAVALLCAGIGGNIAVAASGSDEEAAARGAVTYRVYCASCHGAGAHGDGKLAKSLDPKPADLTQLAKRNDGVFPAERAREVIDGRKEVAEHGDRDMPVWGQSFQQEGKGDQEKAIAAKVDDLVAYLASIQLKS